MATEMAVSGKQSSSGWWSQAGPQAGGTAEEHLQRVILGAPLQVWCFGGTVLCIESQSWMGVKALVEVSLIPAPSEMGCLFVN